MTNPSRPDPTNTRASLLFRLKPGTPAREVAWVEFYDRYAPIISGFARKFGLPAQDVQDLVQEILIGFFTTVPQFEYDPSKGSFRAYLKTCTIRACARYMKKATRFAGSSIQSLDPADEAVERAWSDVWETEKLRRALDTVRQNCLKREDRAKTFRAFEMYVLLERPVDEVAAELAISTDSVHQAKTRISRALREAVAALETEGE